MVQLADGKARARAARWAWRGGAAAVLVFLVACGGGGAGAGGSGGDNDGSDGDGTVQVVSPTVPSAVTQAVVPGRLLASNCFQCHGTNGTGGFDNIRGGEAGEVAEYRNLARRPARSDIMAAHAQGYTDAQISAILQYLASR